MLSFIQPCSTQNLKPPQTHVEFYTALLHQEPENMVWLNLFNVEMSQKRYWQGLRSQEVGEEGDHAYH